MKIAELDRQIIISSKTITLDSVGGEVETWSTLHTVWAKRTSRPSREFYEAGRVISEQLYYYTIRHLTDLNTTLRLTDGSDIFDILEIRYSDQRDYMVQLTCRKVV